MKKSSLSVPNTSRVSAEKRAKQIVVCRKNEKKITAAIIGWTTNYAGNLVLEQIAIVVSSATKISYI